MPDLHQLPVSLRPLARAVRLGPDVPALLIRPPANPGAAPIPAIIWMHGRTAHKEMDPGRYLRLVRAGVGVCALDLPGHGERRDERLQGPAATLDVVARMAEELDAVVADAVREGAFEPSRLALGGFSAGGMVTLLRLTRPHRFGAALVEATTGDWSALPSRPLLPAARVDALDPLLHLQSWRPLPLLAIHATHDEWVPVGAQRRFVEAVAAHSPGVEVRLLEFDRTGAPAEHIGFGRYGSQAKDAGTEFLVRHLQPVPPAAVAPG